MELSFATSIFILVLIYGFGLYLAIKNLGRDKALEIKNRAEQKREINRKRAAQLGLEIVRPNE